MEAGLTKTSGELGVSDHSEPGVWIEAKCVLRVFERGAELGEAEAPGASSAVFRLNEQRRAIGQPAVDILEPFGREFLQSEVAASTSEQEGAHGKLVADARDGRRAGPNTPPQLIQVERRPGLALFARTRRRTRFGLSLLGASRHLTHFLKRETADHSS